MKELCRYSPFTTNKGQYISSIDSIKSRDNDEKNKSNFNIFSKFINKNSPLLCNDKDKIYIDFLINHIKSHKFITFDISEENNAKNSINKDNEKETDFDSKIYNFIVCFEGECIIIEEITLNNIQCIIQQLNQQKISILNVSENLKILNKVEKK